MSARKGYLFLGSALSLVLLSSQAQAHWCDDLWASSYNIVVKPDSDTSPQNIYVQNNMGYQLPNFKLTATGSGGAITLTAPTLKVSGTLLPGEKGTWKIASGSPAKIEDVTFSVSFGNSGESKCYPTKGANPVMVVKTDGTLHPAAPPPGLDSPVNPGCTGDLAQGRSLQYEAVADFEDVSTGLDSLLKLYCAGRGSFGSTDGVTMSNCKDASSTSCPTTKPAAKTGSKYDYMHLWAAGELAARKSALGARTAVLRARLQCGVNDDDVGFAGYALFMLGYLGDDTTAKAFIQTQVSAGGDVGTIGKAALYLMGDTSQKADVQAGAQTSSNSTFVKAACAAALGIVDKDDATVSSVLIPLVKWNEPDSASEDGQGMFAAHLLGLVAWDRRSWAPNGGDTGPVSFYGDTTPATGGNGGGTGGVTSSGGVSGAGGAGGNKDAGGSDARLASGGATGRGGVGGSGGVAGSVGGAGAGGKTGSGGATGAGGTTGAGGAIGEGGATGPGGTTNAGGSSGAGGTHTTSGGTSGEGGSSGSGGDTGTGTTSTVGDSTGCKCNVGSHGAASPTLYLLMMAGLAWIAGRRRRE